MNNNYYQKPIYDGNDFISPNNIRKNSNNTMNHIDIFNLNKGKIVCIYINGNCDKILTGIIENAGSGYIIISDPKTGKWTMVLLSNISHVMFEENINY